MVLGGFIMTEKSGLNKQIKVAPSVHYDIKVTAAKEGKEMRELIEKAWEFYKKNKND